MKKNNLKNKIEPFIFNKLKNSNYEVKRIKASNLLTWNRLDLAFKLFYLDYKNKNTILAEKVYKEDIKSQTLGKFIEYGNENNKNNFETYLNKFNDLFHDIKNNGFDFKTSIIPLSEDGTLINGAHRLSASIFLDKHVECIVTEEKSMIADYNYFFKRNITSNTLDLVVNKFIEYSRDNIYVAFLWPSGKGDNKLAESYFTNIVYKKSISLSFNGAFNLLVELYKHMKWTGSQEAGFPGIRKKLIECFPVFKPITVLVFQSETIEDVKIIKEKVRQVHGIGFSSIHITDSKEEAIRISKLIFNENGIHFLNYAKPYRYSLLSNELNKFNSYLKTNNYSNEDVVLDGSIILSQYGLRKNADIDYLSFESINNPKYESHDSQLKFHKKTKDDLIYNPQYYFQYNNFKFISFNQTYLMKMNRNEQKDKTDCGIMISSIENNRFKTFILKKKQSFFYGKIKLISRYNKFKFLILKKSGLYKPVRYIYKKIKK